MTRHKFKRIWRCAASNKIEETTREEATLKRGGAFDNSGVLFQGGSGVLTFARGNRHTFK